MAALRRIIRAVDLHSRRLADEHGLTGPQVAVLQELARSGPLPASTLARAVHLSGATISGILARLAKRGLVSRERSDRDRRVVLAELTSDGAASLLQAPSLLQDRFREQLAGLADWEQSSMLAALQRIASMMDAEALDAAPHLVTTSVVDPIEAPVADDSAPGPIAPHVDESSRAPTAGDVDAAPAHHPPAIAPAAAPTVQQLDAPRPHAVDDGTPSLTEPADPVDPETPTTPPSPRPPDP